MRIVWIDCILGPKHMGWQQNSTQCISQQSSSKVMYKFHFCYSRRRQHGIAQDLFR